jgi:hypothetical protein
MRCIFPCLHTGYEQIEVASDLLQMKAMCLNAEENTPLAIEPFPMTEQLGYWRQGHFQKLCDRVDVA